MQHAGLMNYFIAIKLFYVEELANRHITRDVWILLLALFLSIDTFE
jgi:hypothetical protein